MSSNDGEKGEKVETKRNKEIKNRHPAKDVINFSGLIQDSFSHRRRVLVPLSYTSVTVLITNYFEYNYIAPFVSDL